ncbi:hypothetical protein C900_04894 [Fulvivirga imtechensis AK7]|uniref:YkuD domain-containing protein n=1 Tax=Fulvivirga imtechensis AK7 TaxID=1237149 RepID=L8JQB4_9BACT|nr:murein L,D-transpeptidase catalytic domain family protein [Fulvivirga imtechensis]ELR69669.1 hypothetical protein C900_04894 [Fulvivirga imtechensis AK7]
MKKVLVIASMLLISSASIFAIDPKSEKSELLTSFVESTYNLLKYEGKKPDFELYKRGIVGYLNLKKQNKLSNSKYLTLIDFRLSSNKKRMWVIDIKQNKVVYHSLVAHGRNTGNEFAKVFSNTPNSNSSSLGFYLTAETYYGKHGLSLRLDGMEPGFNNNARKRAVVMHSADYVDKSYTEAYGRIGRSFGCPSIPIDGHKELIGKLANNSCLFIYYPDKEYLQKSVLANEANAYEMLESSNYLL